MTIKLPEYKLAYKDGRNQRTLKWLEKDTKDAKALKEELWDVFSEIRINIKADDSKVLKKKLTSNGKSLEEIVKLAASIRTANTNESDTHVIGLWGELFFAVVRSMGPNDNPRRIFEDWFNHFLKGIEDSRDEYDGAIETVSYKFLYEIKGIRPEAKSETYPPSMVNETNNLYPDFVITIEVAGIPEPTATTIWDEETSKASQSYVTMTFKNIKDFWEQLKYDGPGSPKAIKGRHNKSRFGKGSYIDHTEEQLKTELTDKQKIFSDHLEDRGISEASKRWLLARDNKSKPPTPRKFT